MNSDAQVENGETLGATGFIRSQHLPTDLFRVSPGIPCDYALEQASTVLGCVHKLILTSVMEEDDATLWAAYYLSGFAKAIIDDVDLGMKTA
ncbi:DUF3077 domain-containing protein [Pseudomonas donghuensis]|uniref:DUF3077 domain-containing protein n=1 Tax=Pseudomonas donghuensis TaxID=1163398 RepID=UPI0039DFF482